MLTFNKFEFVSKIDGSMYEFKDTLVFVTCDMKSSTKVIQNEESQVAIVCVNSPFFVKNFDLISNKEKI